MISPWVANLAATRRATVTAEPAICLFYPERACWLPRRRVRGQWGDDRAVGVCGGRARIDPAQYEA